MKRNFTKAWVTILCFLLCAFSLSAQETTVDYGSATLDNNMLIVLDTTSELKTSYKASLESLGLTSQDEADLLFNGFMDNILSFTPDFAGGFVVITLSQDYAPSDWGVTEWNNYLKSKSDNYIASH